MNNLKFFQYGTEEINYLKSKDETLAALIERIGHIYRPLDSDLFSSVIHHIVGQQISSKAQKTIWQRINDAYGDLNPEKIISASVEELQSFGITFRKAEYIRDFCGKINSREFNLDEIYDMTDEDAIISLSSLKGVGVWTAEMILLFCLQRRNIFSFNDRAIQRGLCAVYHHRKIDRKLFEKYRRRFSPYCSVASLYLWEASK